jgi:catechol 2,3-dioxygenase-like lactoylglutathione lyase family enzyme
MSVTAEKKPAGDQDPSKVGKGARKLASRSSQAVWEPGPDRVGPLEVLAEQDLTRVPELVPVRYGRMLASAFTFYRGAAAIMAADLATGPDSGLRVQLCGDAHLSNFGVFQAPDRRLVFDINDFDETLPGPFEWDVKRLAASVAIGARDRQFSAVEGEAAVLAAVGAYRTAMAGFAAMGDLDVWYARLDVDEAVSQWQQDAKKAERRRLGKNLDKARNKGSLRALANGAKRSPTDVDTDPARSTTVAPIDDPDPTLDLRPHEVEGECAKTRRPARRLREMRAWMSTDTGSESAAGSPPVRPGEVKLEVVVLSVSDVDRAKAFYLSLGWRLDADLTVEDGYRVVQLTPPGSACSIIFGDGVTAAPAGAADGLQLSVYDIDAARADLVARGVEVSEPFHDETGIFHHAGTAARVDGAAPEHADYGSFVAFSDPDGNGWLMQEIKTRLPGR